MVVCSILLRLCVVWCSIRVVGEIVEIADEIVEIVGSDDVDESDPFSGSVSLSDGTDSVSGVSGDDPAVVFESDGSRYEVRSVER